MRLKILIFGWKKFKKGSKKLETSSNSLNLIYQNAINELVELECDISHLENIGYAIAKTCWVTRTCIYEMRTSTMIKFEEEKVIFAKLYDITYALIKCEIILTGNSTLLEDVNKIELDRIYINQIYELCQELGGLIKQNEELKEYSNAIYSKIVSRYPETEELKNLYNSVNSDNQSDMLIELSKDVFNPRKKELVAKRRK